MFSQVFPVLIFFLLEAIFIQPRGVKFDFESLREKKKVVSYAGANNAK
jgi:hypothetical protein